MSEKMNTTKTSEVKPLVKERLRLALQALLSVQIKIVKDLNRVKSREEKERLYELLKRVNKTRNRVVELYFLCSLQ